jgi:hypothetical protein
VHLPGGRPTNQPALETGGDVSDGTKPFERGDWMDRLYVVVGAVLIQLCLGAVYEWSAFAQAPTTPLQRG